MPSGWQSAPSTGQNGERTFTFNYGDSGAAAVNVQIQIVNAASLWTNIDATGKADSPETALQSIINANSSPQAGSPAIKFSPILSVMIGNLPGKGFIGDIPAGTQPEFQVDIRIALLGRGRALYVSARSNADLWAKAQPIINQMFDSVRINLQNIPTATVTPTPHPCI